MHFATLNARTRRAHFFHHLLLRRHGKDGGRLGWQQDLCVILVDDVDRLEENRSHRVIPPEELLDDRLQGDQVTSRPHVVDKEEVEALTEGEKCCEEEKSQFENHGHPID